MGLTAPDAETFETRPRAQPPKTFVELLLGPPALQSSVNFCQQERSFPRDTAPTLAPGAGLATQNRKEDGKLFHILPC